MQGNNCLEDLLKNTENDKNKNIYETQATPERDQINIDVKDHNDMGIERILQNDVNEESSKIR